MIVTFCQHFEGVILLSLSLIVLIDENIFARLIVILLYGPFFSGGF